MYPAVEPLNLRLPANAAALADLHAALREWLVAEEVGESDAAAIVGACSELAADAIESGGSGTVEIEAGRAAGDVVIRCTAAENWRVEDHPSRHVAALLVDGVAIDRRPGATAVVLRKSSARGLAG